jgi:hypothetical protein
MRNEGFVAVMAMAGMIWVMTSACASTNNQKRFAAPAGGEYLTSGKSPRLVAKMNETDDYSLDYDSAPQETKKIKRSK